MNDLKLKHAQGIFFSVGTVFILQNLTSTEKKLKYYNGRTPIT